MPIERRMLTKDKLLQFVNKCSRFVDIGVGKKNKPEKLPQVIQGQKENWQRCLCYCIPCIAA
jgi:hypothetical protein